MLACAPFAGRRDGHPEGVAASVQRRPDQNEWMLPVIDDTLTLKVIFVPSESVRVLPEPAATIDAATEAVL